MSPTKTTTTHKPSTSAKPAKSEALTVKLNPVVETMLTTLALKNPDKAQSARALALNIETEATEVLGVMTKERVMDIAGSAYGHLRRLGPSIARLFEEAKSIGLTQPMLVRLYFDPTCSDRKDEAQLGKPPVIDSDVKSPTYGQILEPARPSNPTYNWCVNAAKVGREMIAAERNKAIADKAVLRNLLTEKLGPEAASQIIPSAVPSSELPDGALKLKAEAFEKMTVDDLTATVIEAIDDVVDDAPLVVKAALEATHAATPNTSTPKQPGKTERDIQRAMGDAYFAIVNTPGFVSSPASLSTVRNALESMLKGIWEALDKPIGTGSQFDHVLNGLKSKDVTRNLDNWLHILV